MRGGVVSSAHFCLRHERYDLILQRLVVEAVKEESAVLVSGALFGFVRPNNAKEFVEKRCTPLECLVIKMSDDTEGTLQLFQGHQTLQIYYVFMVPYYTRYVNSTGW
jgi:hypothetical protein